MKIPFLAAALLPAAQVTNAHYIFNILFVNGKKVGGEYDYFRRNSNSYNPAFPDIVATNELRCNKGAKPGNAKTYDVKAGDQIGFKIFNNERIEHPGPGFVYMSKAPDGTPVAQYDGSGDWFKAYEVGLCRNSPGSDGSWCSYNKDRLEFQVPPTVPPGEYLVRVEHIGLHEGHVGKAQFYIECAQLRIAGPGGGVPAPLVKIPGIYKASDSGIRYDKWASRPAPYVMPGPPVWNGSAVAAPTA